MKVVVYSSFTFSYLNRARVLYQTLRRFHPDWELVALMTDIPPKGFAFDPAKEPFDRLVYAQDLGIPDFRSWLFKHDVIEVSTAVKGPFLHQECGADADVVIYLDPDTALLNPLDPLIDWLGEYDILLTPHLIDPNTERMSILDNDLSASRTGIFNLGFLAIRTKGEGARFAKWWNDRLLEFCFDDMPNGIFVDQKWCDHVPALFDKVKIVRDPGYNIASWNLSQRTVAVGKDGQVRVNGDNLLRFWHFTKLGPTGDVMTRKYAGDNYPVYEIWNWYKRQVAAATEGAIPDRYWAYDSYADGSKIEKDHRVLYRQRGDLREAFPDPFTAGRGSFRNWLLSEGY